MSTLLCPHSPPNPHKQVLLLLGGVDVCALDGLGNSPRDLLLQVRARVCACACVCVRVRVCACACVCVCVCMPVY
jgi:hypothetical protein